MARCCCYHPGGTIHHLLLLLVLSTDVLAGRKHRLQEMHPTDVLNPGEGATAGGGRSPPVWPTPTHTTASTLEESRISRRTQELMQRLQEQGADTHKASVQFILELYERLERGETLPTASSRGGTGGGTGDMVAGADTIKGLSPTVPRHSSRHPELTLRFPVADAVGFDGPELAELRIRPLEQHPLMEDQNGNGRSAARLARRGSLQRVRVRVLDAEGTRQVERQYRVKWRRDVADGYTVLDVTRILHDMARQGMERYQNGSLEIVLKKTRRPASAVRQTQGRRPRSASALLDVPTAADATSPARLADDILMVVYTKSDGNFFDDGAKSRLNTASTDKSFARNTQSSNGSNSTAIRKSRMRRKIPTSTTQMSKQMSTKRRCALEDMFVDFDVLGWADDIVFPVRYNAHTCGGKCPSPVGHELHPTNHAILQSMMRMHDRHTRRPCCVPVSLKPLMMLFHRDKDKLQNAGNIEIRTHPDMIVDECGCR